MPILMPVHCKMDLTDSDNLVAAGEIKIDWTRMEIKVFAESFDPPLNPSLPDSEVARLVMSTMKSKTLENLNRFLAAQREMSDAGCALMEGMGDDPDFRNRPERQAITTAVCNVMAAPLEIGQVADMIFALLEGKPLSIGDKARLMKFQRRAVRTLA